MRNILIIISLLIFCSCQNKYTLESLDETQHLTIINKKETRYIIPKMVTSIPDSGYIKVTYKNQEMGDQMIGCWNKEGKKWVIRLDGVEVIENKLDTNLYRFYDLFPVETSGIFSNPTTKGYNGRGCFSLDFEFGDLKRVDGDIKEGK